MANKEDKLNNLTKTKISGFSPDHLVTSLRVWLKVGDVMNSDVITISSEETVSSAANIMAENNISCIIIAVDNGSVAGILTETDILKRAVAKEKDFDKVRVADIMSSPVESIPPDFSILEASRIMEAKHIKRLPILTERGLAGIVTQTDLIRALTSYGMWRDVAEIMNRDVAGIQREEAVVDAAKIMASRNISCVIALEAGQVVGVLTERDLLKRVVALKKNPICIKVEQVMSSPAISISPSYSIFSASRIMKKMDIRRLVVMEDKRLCGIVTQTDIFRAIKKKLQAEEEKNFRLLENSKSSIYTIDLEGKTTYVNPSFMKLLDVSDPEEVVNQPFLPERFWLNPEKRARFLKRLLGGGIETMELALKTSKGRKVYVTLFCAFTKNAHGEINGNQGILYDITAKKELVALREAQEALRCSEENYRSIFNSANDAIFVHDIDTGAILDCNQKTCEIFGYTAEEIRNCNVGTLSSGEPPYMQEDALLWLKTAVKGEPQILQWQAKDKSGRLFWAEVNLKAILIGGKKRVLAVLRDISERKQAEEKLQKNIKELERFNRLAVGRELRMIELKKEINALLGELGKEDKYRVDLDKAKNKPLTSKVG